MTDASGKPYVGGAGNGSTASVATSGSATSTASPLRSSLKKPKPLGIHNPGFSAHSPTLSRNGSQKKVRIQTHSTEVQKSTLLGTLVARKFATLRLRYTGRARCHGRSGSTSRQEINHKRRLQTNFHVARARSSNGRQYTCYYSR